MRRWLEERCLWIEILHSHSTAFELRAHKLVNVMRTSPYFLVIMYESNLHLFTLHEYPEAPNEGSNVKVAQFYISID